MAGSHTSSSARDASAETAADTIPLTLVWTVEDGLPERLADRVDAHLAAFAEHMREGCGRLDPDRTASATAGSPAV